MNFIAAQFMNRIILFAVLKVAENLTHYIEHSKMEIQFHEILYRIDL